MTGKWTLEMALLCIVGAGSVAFGAQAPADSSRKKAGAQTHVAFSYALPRMNGQNLKITAVEVTYGPGGWSPPHSHGCPVVGYMLEGSLRSQVKGKTEAVYHAGESFYEGSDAVHMISANASDKVRAKFIAYFICDHDAPLSQPVPADETATH